MSKSAQVHTETDTECRGRSDGSEFNSCPACRLRRAPIARCNAASSLWTPYEGVSSPIFVPNRNPSPSRTPPAVVTENTSPLNELKNAPADLEGHTTSPIDPGTSPIDPGTHNPPTAAWAGKPWAVVGQALECCVPSPFTSPFSWVGRAAHGAECP